MPTDVSSGIPENIVTAKPAAPSPELQELNPGAAATAASGDTAGEPASSSTASSDEGGPEPAPASDAGKEEAAKVAAGWIVSMIAGMFPACRYSGEEKTAAAAVLY